MKSPFIGSLIAWVLPHFLALALVVSALAVNSAAQVVPGSLDVHWDEGSSDCAKATRAPLQVHAYNPHTYILRENLCSTFEAPFLYLIIGSGKALLIDTGDVAEPEKMPLARTVVGLLPDSKLPLIVVHTHRHLDHRAGDAQFSHLPNAQVVGFDIDNVRQFYGFADWPNGATQIDLGDRIVDVIPTPGHNETEVSFYDRNTALFFSGDFLIPGRLLIDDTDAELASAQRIATFVKDRPVSYVLGGHIEKNSQNQLYDWQAPYHPQEHVLQLSKSDLLALPAAIRSFNGFYTQTGNFIMMNSIRILELGAIGVGVLLILLVLLLVHYVKRRRRRRKRAVLAA